MDDNFDEEVVPSGGWVMNDPSFANFNVSTGSVDLLTVGNVFGLAGSGTNTSGNFIDLDGSTHHGGTLQTKSTYDFNAGDVVTLSIDVAGNGRTGLDTLFAGFQFTGAPGITNIAASGLPTITQPGGTSLLGSVDLGSTAPFTVYTISFKATTAGSLTAVVGTNSTDDMGPLLDHVILSDLANAIPEPSSWALLIVGFGGIGALMRRSRVRIATA